MKLPRTSQPARAHVQTPERCSSFWGRQAGLLTKLELRLTQNGQSEDRGLLGHKSQEVGAQAPEAQLPPREEGKVGSGKRIKQEGTGSPPTHSQLVPTTFSTAKDFLGPGEQDTGSKPLAPLPGRSAGADRAGWRIHKGRRTVSICSRLHPSTQNPRKAVPAAPLSHEKGQAGWQP